MDTVRYPAAADSVQAVVGTIVDMNARLAFDAFVAMSRAWHAGLVTYRCSLPPERVAQLRRDNRPWKCDDVEFVVTRLSFDDLDPGQARRHNTCQKRATLDCASAARGSSASARSQ